MVFAGEFPNVPANGSSLAKTEKSSSVSTTMEPSSLGHAAWLLTSPSSEPANGSSAVDTNTGSAGSLMSSSASPASQFDRYALVPSAEIVMSCSSRLADAPKPPSSQLTTRSNNTSGSVSVSGSSGHAATSGSHRFSAPHTLTSAGVVGSVIS